uniref:Uncharacterized protein n=1 Tax=Oryza brachyantha TaxID=4533 RepID=J3NB86_ORYBR
QESLSRRGRRPSEGRGEAAPARAARLQRRAAGALPSPLQICNAQSNTAPAADEEDRRLKRRRK